jgi:hypothetical protein
MRPIQNKLSILMLIAIMACADAVFSQNTLGVDAFPGAEGFGRFTSGGRGGQVYIITSLADDGPGTLREAIRKNHPRTIVFAVSGNIELQSELDINNGDLTIAGQTAPGEGITIQNYPVKLKGNNIIVRFLRFRLGDLHQIQDDALSAIRTKNVIIDHCSLSWGTDECGSFYDSENFTLQWSIISESLNASVHEKGDHGYAGIWGGMGASFHHNLIANHNSRNPRFNGSRYHKQAELEVVDFRNNVIYNWRSNASYGGEQGNHNMVANYYKPGPATSKNAIRFLEPYQPFGRFFLDRNVMEGFEEISGNNALGLHKVAPEQVLADKPFSFGPLETQSPEVAYRDVLNWAGASLFRDKVDERIVMEVEKGQSCSGAEKDGIIDSQEDVGSWPKLKAGKAPVDTDKDGMPDVWELANGLDPNNAEDGKEFTLHARYTNLEVYLNSLVRTHPKTKLVRD